MIGALKAGVVDRWPLCWRSTLDAMRLRLTASHTARVQAEEALTSALTELHKARLLIASQAERIRRFEECAKWTGSTAA